MAGRGVAWLGRVWRDTGWAGQGQAVPGKPRSGKAWPGGACLGRAWQGETRQGKAWPGMAGVGQAGSGTARLGVACPGKVRSGSARLGLASQGWARHGWAGKQVSPPRGRAHLAQEQPTRTHPSRRGGASGPPGERRPRVASRPHRHAVFGCGDYPSTKDGTMVGRPGSGRPGSTRPVECDTGNDPAPLGTAGVVVGGVGVTPTGPVYRQWLSTAHSPERDRHPSRMLTRCRAASRVDHPREPSVCDSTFGDSWRVVDRRSLSPRPGEALPANRADRRSDAEQQPLTRTSSPPATAQDARLAAPYESFRRRRRARRTTRARGGQARSASHDQARLHLPQALRHTSDLRYLRDHPPVQDHPLDPWHVARRDGRVRGPPALKNRGATRDQPAHERQTYDRMTAMDRVLDRLERVQRQGSTTLASCPVASHGKGHGDRNPSLSIAEKDGRVLIHCMGECNTQDVLIAIGLDWPDLYDEPVTNERGAKECEWVYQARDGSPWLTVERWQTPQGKRFVQRVPGSDKAGLPASFKPCLFKLPQVLAAAKAGEEVYVVEGEKCVAAAERLGVVATTAPAGVNGWRDYYTKWLTGCSQVNIVCDNDEVGMRYASAVAASLRGAGIKVRTLKVAVDTPKADLYDHVLAGHTIEDLVPIRLGQFRPEGRLANGLLKEIFPPVEWVIEDLMPVGFTVLGGAPKVGKSFIALDAALNVATGGRWLHNQQCRRGSVLYLSMDNDAEWRLQLRLLHLQKQYGISLAEADIEFHTEFPTGDGAIKAVQEWCAEKRDDGCHPLLVVADTLAKVEPGFDGSGDRNAMNGGYGQSTSNLSKWSQVALDQRIGVLATHHIRKSADEDWMNRFIGSQGIVATATTLMMIDHVRGTKEANLLVASRDAGEHELTMVRENWSWCLQEGAIPESIVTTKAGLHVIRGGQE